MPLMRDNETGNPPPGSTGMRGQPDEELLNPDDQNRSTGTRSRSPTTLNSELLLRVHAQGQIIEAMDDMLSQLTTPSEDIVMNEVTMMLDQLEELHQTYRSEHSWLVAQWPPAHLDHAYFAGKGNLIESKLTLKIKRLLGRLQAQLTPTAQPISSTEPGARMRARLPELTVPTFSGDSRKWPDFKAMFVSVIGGRSDLSELEKFQYLKGAMQGDASELIVNLSPHPASYKAAWTILDARFENKRLIIKTHLERLLNLKPMQKRQASSLTKMVNIINEATQSLRTLTTESNNDCLMVTLVSGLLDKDTREKWETSLTSTDEFPSLSQLTEFLMTRARTLENIEEVSSQTQPNQARGTVPKRANSHQASQQPQASLSKAPTQTASQASQSTQSRSPYPCDGCGQDHYIVVCPKLRNCSLDQRVKLVKDKSLCCNCLGRHNVRKCNSTRRCKTCDGPHHTMLHGTDLTSLFSSSSERAPTTQDTQGATSSSSKPNSA